VIGYLSNYLLLSELNTSCLKLCLLSSDQLKLHLFKESLTVNKTFLSSHGPLLESILARLYGLMSVLSQCTYYANTLGAQMRAVPVSSGDLVDAESNTF
jgi:hypothetical protein